MQTGTVETENYPHNYADYNLDDCGDRIEVSTDRICSSPVWVSSA